MRPRHVVLVAVAGLIVLVGASCYDAFTASATVAASNVGFQDATPVTPSDLEPPECTVSVTSIKAGSGTFSATANNQLVLGSSGKDTVTLMSNDCFVGGGPTTGTYDQVTAGNKSGDQCVVNANANAGKCTVVATRP